MSYLAIFTFLMGLTFDIASNSHMQYEGMSWRSIIHGTRATNGLMDDLCSERIPNSKAKSLDPVTDKGNQNYGVVNEKED
jgi:hypothetical protein